MGSLRLPYSHQKLRSMTPRVASVQKLKGIFPKSSLFSRKSVEKVLLEISQNSQENTCARDSASKYFSSYHYILVQRDWNNTFLLEVYSRFYSNEEMRTWPKMITWLDFFKFLSFKKPGNMFNKIFLATIEHRKKFKMLSQLRTCVPFLNVL